MGVKATIDTTQRRARLAGRRAIQLFGAAGLGSWAQRHNGTIAYKLLEDVGAEAERAVECAAHDLSIWLSPVYVTPRVRMPLERELSA